MSYFYTLKKHLEELHCLLSSKNQSKCLQKIDILCEFFDGQQSNNEIRKTLSLLPTKVF